MRHGGAVGWHPERGWGRLLLDSGAVTSFSRADGFVAIDALRAGLDAGGQHKVTLIGAGVRAPDIVIMGSHCVALDIVIGRLAEQGFSARTVAVGSMGGVAAAE